MEQQLTRDMYLELLKKAVSGQIIEDAPLAAFPMGKPLFWALLRGPRRFDPKLREIGRDWPSQAHTMIGTKRLNNVQHCVETVLSDEVPGDLIETGVWRGGATVLMRGILKAHGVTDRTVWLADSFAGLPAPNAKRYPLDRFWHANWVPFLAVTQDQVRANFTKYGLLDDQVKFLQGWFRDTLPTAPIKQLAVLRMDGDLYESTMDALTHLYPKLSPGGFVIVDDYCLKPCQAAVSDYRRTHDITDPIMDIDGTGAYWRRSAAT